MAKICRSNLKIFTYLKVLKNPKYVQKLSVHTFQTQRMIGVLACFKVSDDCQIEVKVPDDLGDVLKKKIR